MPASKPSFSGSYAPEDVTFLLQPITLPYTDIAAKERAIQSGARHYSEMLSHEPPPSEEYLRAFMAAFQRNRRRVGRDIAGLAKRIAAGPPGELALVSLARAGSPAGVLLRRALLHLGRPARHYSISIIRDKGIDLVALRQILRHHPPSLLLFVDGWTGKGAILHELSTSLARDMPALAGVPLCVLADLAGGAALAAGAEDYLIPWAVLNGCVSGLISRTVHSASLIGPDDFHGCVVLHHLRPADLSRWYVDEQMRDIRPFLDDPTLAPIRWEEGDRAAAARISTAYVARIMKELGIQDRSRVKPGIGEATRAVLRRLPERLFVRDPEDEEIRHLRLLAATKGLRVECDPDLPYRAAAIIRTVGGSSG